MKVRLFLIFSLMFAFVAQAQLSVFNHTTWERVSKQHGSLASRDIFAYALFLCENKQHLDRLGKLFETAKLMQDRNINSRGYGNFKWSWQNAGVMDFNAVEFCMSHATILWKDYRQLLTPAQQELLKEIMEYSAKSCMNHRVRVSYTNIFIMNFVNLILLGELFDMEDVLKEGHVRLNEFMAFTAVNGIAEYSSPNYAGIDIICLSNLYKHTSNDEVKKKAEKLLKLFWAEAIANTFPPANRYAGAHSRDYDYLYGNGDLTPILQLTGLIKAPEKPRPTYWNETDWLPSDDIKKMASVTPRYIESIWGEKLTQNRIHWVGKNISLSVAGQNYHTMDIPLAVNFASDKTIPRCYFIPDGRRDPYGKKRIVEGSGPHRKTLHLTPFWAAAQRNQDALGMVLYRQRDIPESSATLESHLVIPAEVDEIVVGDKAVTCEPDKPFVIPIDANTPVFVRSKAGAMAVKLPWAIGRTTNQAPMAFVWDGNSDMAARITVQHHDTWALQTPPGPTPPGAAFWIRVCDDAGTPEAFKRFMQDFAKAPATVEHIHGSIRVLVPGLDGELELLTASPFYTPQRIVPAPKRSILAINGKDWGFEWLKDTPGIGKLKAQQQLTPPASKTEPTVTVVPGKKIVIEAESGAFIPEMALLVDPDASGGKGAWTPGAPGTIRRANGCVSWKLNITEDFMFYVAGRVKTATPDDDSFFITILTNEGVPVVDMEYWTLPVTEDAWDWAFFQDKKDPVPFKLRKGTYRFLLQTREDGTKIDQLMLTPKPTFK